MMPWLIPAFRAEGREVLVGRFPFTAKSDLRGEISERIDYYVGDGDTNTNDGDRAQRQHNVLNADDFMIDAEDIFANEARRRRVPMYFCMSRFCHRRFSP